MVIGTLRVKHKSKTDLLLFWFGFSVIAICRGVGGGRKHNIGFSDLALYCDNAQKARHCIPQNYELILVCIFRGTS